MPETYIREEVYCTLQLPGIHCWTDCPLEEVRYLRDPHRHMFHFKCHMVVNHSDRDCEFIMLKTAVEAWLREQYWDDDLKVLYFGSMSCEMIAKKLIDEFGLCQCEVSEDDENGAILRVLKTSSETGGGMV